MAYRHSEPYTPEETITNKIWADVHKKTKELQTAVDVPRMCEALIRDFNLKDQYQVIRQECYRELGFPIEELQRIAGYLASPEDRSPTIPAARVPDIPKYADLYSEELRKAKKEFKEVVASCEEVLKNIESDIPVNAPTSDEIAKARAKIDKYESVPEHAVKLYHQAFLEDVLLDMRTYAVQLQAAQARLKEAEESAESVAPSESKIKRARDKVNSAHDELTKADEICEQEQSSPELGAIVEFEAELADIKLRTAKANFQAALIPFKKAEEAKLEQARQELEAMRAKEVTPVIVSDIAQLKVDLSLAERQLREVSAQQFSGFGDSGLYHLQRERQGVAIDIASHQIEMIKSQLQTAKMMEALAQANALHAKAINMLERAQQESDLSSGTAGTTKEELAVQKIALLESKESWLEEFNSLRRSQDAIKLGNPEISAIQYQTRKLCDKAEKIVSATHEEKIPIIDAKMHKIFDKEAEEARQRRGPTKATKVGFAPESTLVFYDHEALKSAQESKVLTKKSDGGDRPRRL